MGVLLASVQAWAHGLEIRMSPDGSRIIGQVVYEDGAPWFAETVTIDNLTAPETEQLTLTTDAAGGFSAAGVIGHEYRITARDETGHAVEVLLTLDGSSASNHADTGSTPDDGAPDSEGGGIPFYVIAGALLLLSIIPAKYLQKKSSRNA
ncbi:hypothetical protein GCM10011403_19060 [Pseudohongiella nitratireducens]|jgi:hypothetical protein|uniref:Carboxypeptidase regulatory-like domain-containing protein n=1 Tax=Pseudohongiella nitratireducens TaxID=1768907 RepID=A0A916QJQ6_9GAMM|nr:carboxypeptidase-like regulatory domain-containing protein [Pseudohongiella nitratireducens]MDF1622229.1 carboxypeptidase-like regulatory domain-containing protein [Pseudohongiella nitratireducens]GFZ76144.1 hypothetical protein GCM10011403_19060 [Pseudohongiella nitratireducens]|tara:strand:- start:3612 stop:4061 length:450 start_codon:yes stop_codon:yes gene_type:complete